MEIITIICICFIILGLLVWSYGIWHGMKAYRASKNKPANKTRIIAKIDALEQKIDEMIDKVERTTEKLGSLDGKQE